MALRNQPYLPLYVQDFASDEKLAECSAESTGVYIRLMCLMHKSEEYGVILLKQNDKQKSSTCLNFATKLARHFPYSVEVIERSLDELVANGVVTMEDDRLIQKRMVKDNRISLSRSAAGKKGGDKTTFAQAKKQAKGQAKHQANSENENEYVGDIKSLKKTKYADYVSMTEGEYKALVKRVGESGAKRCIEILDNYKGANGKKYDSDYRAILNWVEKRWREEGEKPSADQFPDFA